MSDVSPWWQLEAPRFLDITLSHINDSRMKDEVIGRCEALCKALNKTWNAFFEHRRNAGALNETEQANEAEGHRRDNQSLQELVLHVAERVIADLFDILFDRPSQRLAVYGTLAPDGANASQLAGLDGQWQEGAAKGIIEERDGFLEFHWMLKGSSIPVNVFSTPKLETQFDRLDKFEGPHYRRILVPIVVDGRILICNIYEGN